VHAIPAATPMRYITYPASAKSDTVYVLLPGLKDRAKAFDHWGFISVFVQHHVAADLVAADAHVGYYTEGLLIRRLHDDVIAPLTRRYPHVVLVGVSMGGYGAIRYAMAYPGTIDKVVLFSPFLGAGPLMRNLAEAGDDDFKQTWAWLRGTEHPPIFLAYGHEDGFLATDHELKALLPPENVTTGTGGHLWTTWRRLLKQMIDHGVL
jgi:pimeloyl-ACP methyl ester carboxylesterase